MGRWVQAGASQSTCWSVVARVSPRHSRRLRVRMAPRTWGAAVRAQDGGIEARVGQFQGQGVLPINTAPHRIGRLTILQPLDTREAGGHQQATGGAGRLADVREELGQRAIGQRLRMHGHRSLLYADESRSPCAGDGQSVAQRQPDLQRHRVHAATERRFASSILKPPATFTKPAKAGSVSPRRRASYP